MGAGYSDGHFIVFHDLTQELCAGKHGNTKADRFLIFRIVRMDGCSIDDQIG